MNNNDLVMNSDHMSTLDEMENYIGGSAEKGELSLKKRLLYAALTGTVYVLIYFISRYYFDIGQQFYMYTPSWTARNVLWFAALISIIPSFFGYYRFSVITLAGYILGVIAGEIFGGFHSDIPPVYPHYGWIIWGTVYISAAIIAILVEKNIRKNFGTQ